MAVQASPAQAITVSNYYNIRVYNSNDYFLNYDNGSANYSNTNVDSPVNLVFWGWAEIDHVKDTLRYKPDGTYTYLSQGDPMYEHMEDPDTGPPDIFWDQDGGIKNTALTGCTTTAHMRQYSGALDYGWNPTLSFYTVATSHKDHGEFCSGALYGFNETAESDLVSRANGTGTFSTVPNYLGLLNDGSFQQGDHVFMSDGKASKVYVPTW